MLSPVKLFAPFLAIGVVLAAPARPETPGFPAARREACQTFPKGGSPNLRSCPRNTIYVSATDKNANYQTVQDAVQSLVDDGNPKYILVGSGTYTEQVNVTQKSPLTIIGQITSRSATANLVTITYSQGVTQDNKNGVFLGSNIDNALTSVLTVAPSLNASLTGSGYSGFPVITDPAQFGCTDFKMYNIDLDQTYGPAGTGPALAVSVSYAYASFYGVSAKGIQDTVYCGHNCTALFLKSTILGSIDYLYGFGTLWIEQSTLGNRGAGGGVVAWKGSLLPKNNLYGCYISNSHLTRASDINSTLDITGQVALGRPWNNASRVIYMNNLMDDQINPAGFIEWSKTDPRLQLITFGEYQSSGPGYTPAKRAFFPDGTPLGTYPTSNAQMEFDLTSQQAATFDFRTVVGGDVHWVDRSYAGQNFSI